MSRSVVFIASFLLFSEIASGSFALLGGCDDIEKDFQFEKALRVKCNQDLEAANQRAAEVDNVNRELGDCKNEGKKLKTEIEKLKKDKEYAKGEAQEYEDMLNREQAESRKKDNRCKACEEELSQVRNKLMECEDKLIVCGTTESPQAKKHMEFLKEQINDLRKHRDRLELEVEDIQGTLRNSQFAESLCQSNYTGLYNQFKEYKAAEEQRRQTREPTPDLPFPLNMLQQITIGVTIFVVVAAVIIVNLVNSNSSLKVEISRLKKANEKLEDENADLKEESYKMNLKNATLEERNTVYEEQFTRGKEERERITKDHYTSHLASLSADEEDGDCGHMENSLGGNMNSDVNKDIEGQSSSRCKKNQKGEDKTTSTSGKALSNDELSGMLNNLGISAKELRSLIAQHQKESDLSSAVADLTSKVEGLTSAVTKLKKDNEDMKNELADVSRTGQTLESELIRLKGEVVWKDEFSKKVGDLTSTTDDLQSGLKAVKKLIENDRGREEELKKVQDDVNLLMLERSKKEKETDLDQASPVAKAKSKEDGFEMEDKVDQGSPNGQDEHNKSNIDVMVPKVEDGVEHSPDLSTVPDEQETHNDVVTPKVGAATETVERNEVDDPVKPVKAIYQSDDSTNTAGEGGNPSEKAKNHSDPEQKESEV